MGRRNRRTLFSDSLDLTRQSHMLYFMQLTELAISTIEWKNLPDTIDPRFLELMLFEQGSVVFFEDDVIGPQALCSANNGPFNVTGIPINRRAYSPYNGYQNQVDISNSVLCYNNMVRTPTYPMAMYFAKILYDLDLSVRVNAKAQKTPVLVQGNEKQRLTLQNLYQKYEGNEPFIFGDESLNPNALKVFNTNAPYNADKLYNLKIQYYNEALTYLGIPNVNTQKKERMITDEVSRQMGGTIASRYSRLEMREEACDKINKMFGWGIDVGFRDLQEDDDTLLEPKLSDIEEGENGT